MKVKIISDGRAIGTSIVDAETGAPVNHVQSVSFTHEAGKMPTATITVFLTEVDLVSGSERVVVCPACRKQIADSHLAIPTPKGQ